MHQPLCAEDCRIPLVKLTVKTWQVTVHAVMQDALPAKHALQRSRSAGSCAAEAKACRPGKRLFGIVAEDQSEWQPLVRESSQVCCPLISALDVGSCDHGLFA